MMGNILAHKDSIDEAIGIADMYSAEMDIDLYVYESAVGESWFVAFVEYPKFELLHHAKPQDDQP